MSDRGILAYSNQKLEWILPWWVDCVRKQSTLPITIIDAGMSKRMSKWCRSHARVIRLTDQIQVASKGKIAPDLQAQWESLYFGDVWEGRKAWFLKPQVLNLTPYQKTLYLDIDCQVVDEIESLFDIESKCSLVQEPIENQEHLQKVNSLPKGRILYNSGVILFEKNTPLILEWEEATKYNTHKFMGDEDLLSALIHEKYPILDLNSKFNCRPDSPLANEAHILHHVGLKGKRDILAFMIESFSDVTDNESRIESIVP